MVSFAATPPPSSSSRRQGVAEAGRANVSRQLSLVTLVTILVFVAGASALPVRDVKQWGLSGLGERENQQGHPHQGIEQARESAKLKLGHKQRSDGDAPGQRAEAEDIGYGAERGDRAMVRSSNIEFGSHSKRGDRGDSVLHPEIPCHHFVGQDFVQSSVRDEEEEEDVEHSALEMVRVHQGMRQLVPDEVQVTAYPATLASSGDTVQVSWTRTHAASSWEGAWWIGAYLVGDDVGVTAPIKYHMVNHDKKSGQASLSLVNMRSPYVFYLFKGGLMHPKLIAISNVTVTFSNIWQPLHPRLSLSGGSSMTVTWDAGRGRGGGVVYWVNRSSADVVRASEGEERAYGKEDMCGGVAVGVGYRGGGSTVSASMDLTGFLPGELVGYRVGSDRDGWSGDQSFNVQPPPGGTIRMVAFGDLGTFSGDGERPVMFQAQGSHEMCEAKASLATTRNILDHLQDTDLVLHIGDISYAKGYASVWDSFFHQISPISQRIPWMVGIGNHERDWPGSGSAVGAHDSGGECGVPYAAKFRMPDPSPGAVRGSLEGLVKDTPWYGFDFGSVHVSVLSSEHDPEAQVGWLREDLAHARVGRAAWLVVAVHRPLYVSAFPANKKVEKEGLVLRAAWEKAMQEGGVDVVLVGHHHSYQRSCPIINGNCSQGGVGIVHVVAGMAGKTSTPVVPQPGPHPYGPLWERVDSEHHGYGLVSANASHFVWEYYRNDGVLFDSFVLHRGG